MDFGRFSDETVDLAVDLVNTLDLEGDRLGTAEDLRDFLHDHGWHVAAEAVRPDDVAGVRAGRAALRQVFEAAERSVGAAVLNRLVRATGASPQLTDHDGQPWHLHFVAVGAPVHDRLIGACAAALMLGDDPSGRRLGVCDAEDCRWVYVDTSKNHSRRHCGAACSSRERVRAHRRRKSGRDPAGPSATPS